MPHAFFSPTRQAAILSLSLISSLLPCQSAQAASEPADRYVYRWSFEAGGLAEIPRMDTSGGELTVAGGESGQVPLFQRTGGVSASSPDVLNASRNIYGSTSGAQITSYGSPLRTAKTVDQFTITMWIKAEIPPEKQPQARLFNISTDSNEMSSQSVFIGLESGGFALCVNGSAYYRVETTESVVKPGEWVFLVFSYDGVAENPYYSHELNNAFKIAKNGAIFAGDPKQPTRLIAEAAVNTGAPNYNVSPGKTSLNGLLAAVGSSNSRFDRSFVGWIDDVRLYDSLLSLPDLERVRLEAVGK